MIAPALIAEEVKTQTYSQVARKHGLTRGQVAGVAYRLRVRRPCPRPSSEYTRVPPPPEPFVQYAVLELMSDGRERTTQEIAARTGHRVNSVFDALRSLTLGGAMLMVTRGRGSLPSTWQEAPE